MNDLPTLFVVLFFGLCVGSFLNVCIHRLPISKSIVSPPSACPVCGYHLKPYDNIPVISYLMLKGKCRQCKTSISIRYPMIEIMTGLFALCVALKFGLNLTALAHFIFIAVLTVITYIDLDHFIIPDVLSLPGIPVFFLLSFLNPQMNWLDSLIGILVGGGILYLIAFLYTLVTGKEGMGGGDIKLLAMIGAFVGLKGVVFTIFVSSLIGTISGLVIMIAKGKDFKLKIPFGPFLAIGAISYVFFGNYMIRWYFNMAAA